MSTMKVLNMAGAEVGTVELNDAIFGIEPNQTVVHEVVKNHPRQLQTGYPEPSPAPKSPVAAESPGVRRAPATPGRAAPVLPSGLTAASCLPPSPGITAMC